MAVGEAADTFDGFLNGFFPFAGRDRGDDSLERGGKFAASLPGFLGGAGPGPIDFVFGCLDFVKASFRERAREFRFVGETEDVRRIRVGLGNLDVFQERTNHGVKERIFFARSPDDEGDAAFGFQHAAHFPKGLLDVWNEHDAETAGDAIEMAVREWELFGVGGVKFHIAQSPGGGVFFCSLQHFANEIGSNDTPLRANRSGDGKRGFARATGEIEYVESGRKRGAFDDEFGGAARLMSKPGRPLFPEGSSVLPFLADGFAGIRRLSEGCSGHNDPSLGLQTGLCKGEEKISQRR